MAKVSAAKVRRKTEMRFSSHNTDKAVSRSLNLNGQIIQIVGVAILKDIRTSIRSNFA